ncbi:uncharacterized protein LTR77_001221 [Saxophila tyrrhenica]|uniref:Ketoreductase domain-containing protein n=1 Tax=Saxophila tyrrhenica TaxID=1690608 RepID=A0AAV9PMP3_9PEZI|nr:hypothetical protein LTR77_001221 [Saxophila tyrrhenica]
MGRDNDFTGKTIAISGGASGIGLATAQTIYSRGGSISIADVDQNALDEAAASFQDRERVMLTKVDVSNRKEVDQWIATTIERFGSLDGAANCAGIIGKHHGTRTVEQQDDDQWDMIMRVNLTGMMYVLRAELQAMKGPGGIVCVSSIQGTMGFAKHAAYTASKHGMLGLVRSAAKEVGERNIRVNSVAPGSIATPLMDKRNALEGVVPHDYHPTPISRLGKPDEVGNLIAFLLSDESAFISGATYAIDGAWAC